MRRSRSGTQMESGVSSTWIELAMVFKLQTGYNIGGKGTSLAEQADILRKMIRNVWNKTVHKTQGRVVSAKVFWRPGIYVASTEVVTNTKAAGILRRPVLPTELWRKIVQLLEMGRDKKRTIFGSRFLHTILRAVGNQKR